MATLVAFSKLSVGRRVSSVTPFGCRPVGAEALTVDPSRFANASAGVAALGERGDCGVLAQLTTISPYTTGQASNVFLCIEQLLLVSKLKPNERASSAAERRA